MKPFAFVLVLAALVLSAFIFINPHLNVPVLSPVICSVKGGTWYDGGILGLPGCYAHS